MEVLKFIGVVVVVIGAALLGKLFYITHQDNRRDKRYKKRSK